MSDPILAALVERLSAERSCHTILLYGSWARGNARADSDYDVAAFSDDEPKVSRLTGRWRGALLDVFVYPTARLTEAPFDGFLRMRSGIVLKDRDGVGARFLAALDDIHAKGPEPQPADELEAIRNWAWKTLDRTAVGDVEAHYRRAHLLTVLLESYFALRGAWFPGSKEAFAILQETDRTGLSAFEAAFAPGAPIAAIEALVVAVCGPRPG